MASEVESLAKVFAENLVSSRQIKEIMLKSLDKGVKEFEIKLEAQASRKVIPLKVLRELRNLTKKYDKNKLKEILIRANDLADFEFIRPLAENETIVEEIKEIYGINLDNAKFNVERGSGSVTIKVYLPQEDFKNLKNRMDLAKYIKNKISSELKKRMDRVPPINILIYKG